VNDRERQAWVRFLVMVAAGALGETVGIWLRVPSSDLLMPLLFGGAAFYLTQGRSSTGGRGDDNRRYWRGRRLN
jgi:hypothetical protein